MRFRLITLSQVFCFKPDGKVLAAKSTAVTWDSRIGNCFAMVHSVTNPILSYFHAPVYASRFTNFP